MSWPYITKELANVGSTEVPDFQYIPKIIYIPGRRGPWQSCRECRETKDEAHKKLTDQYLADWREYEEEVARAIEMPVRPKEPKLPPIQVNFAIMGSGRCVKHILRFHKKNGTLTPELEADVKRRDGIHDKLRRGNYAQTI